MKKSYSKKWQCTDSDSQQYGRQLTESQFEFKQDTIGPNLIDLNKYTFGQIESIISSYGYTLYEEQENSRNIHELYDKSANWIIAECIFEYESGLY